MDPSPAPTLVDASLAAEKLPGSVLLFGSVARGDPSEWSDIDLIAIVDCVDTRRDSKDRAASNRHLEHQAAEACGFPVQVWLIDWPEWKSHSPVWGTVEYSAKKEGTWLKRRPPKGSANWRKQPPEIQVRIKAAIQALRAAEREFQQAITSIAYPPPHEQELLDQEEHEQHLLMVQNRLAAINQHLHVALEQLLIVLLRLSRGSFQREQHQLNSLFHPLPREVRYDLASYLGGSFGLLSDDSQQEALHSKELKKWTDLLDARGYLWWVSQWRAGDTYHTDLIETVRVETSRVLGRSTMDVAEYTEEAVRVFKNKVLENTEAAVVVSEAAVQVIEDVVSELTPDERREAEDHITDLTSRAWWMLRNARTAADTMNGVA